MAPVESIADAIVEHLNALDLDTKFKAYKPEIATLKAEESGLVVQVIPVAGGSRDKVGRHAIRRQYSVNLYVTDPLKDRTRASMVSLVDTLLDQLELVRMAGKTWSRSEEVSLYDRQAQKESGRFASLHRIDYSEEYCK